MPLHLFSSCTGSYMTYMCLQLINKWPHLKKIKLILPTFTFFPSIHIFNIILNNSRISQCLIQAWNKIWINLCKLIYINWQWQINLSFLILNQFVTVNFYNIGYNVLSWTPHRNVIFKVLVILKYKIILL